MKRLLILLLFISFCGGNQDSQQTSEQTDSNEATEQTDSNEATEKKLAMKFLKMKKK